MLAINVAANSFPSKFSKTHKDSMTMTSNNGCSNSKPTKKINILYLERITRMVVRGPKAITAVATITSPTILIIRKKTLLTLSSNSNDLPRDTNEKESI